MSQEQQRAAKAAQKAASSPSSTTTGTKGKVKGVGGVGSPSTSPANGSPLNSSFSAGAAHHHHHHHQHQHSHHSKSGKGSAAKTPAATLKAVPLLSHLSLLDRKNPALAELRAQGHVHPSVISLGVQFSEFIIAGGNARCLAMLAAFKRVSVRPIM